MTDYDLHRKVASLEKRITRLESGFQELDKILDPEGWVGEAFKLLEQDIDEVKEDVKEVKKELKELKEMNISLNNKVDIILQHITGLKDTH